MGLLQLHARIDDVQLAISEVVSNAVRHRRLCQHVDSVRITVGIGPDKVRVTVVQPTIADVQFGEPRFETENPGGFGLRLVDGSWTAGGTIPVRPGAYGWSSRNGLDPPILLVGPTSRNRTASLGNRVR
jgi:hypothetical protein